MIEAWTILALVSLTTYGLAQIVNKTALRGISAPSYIFLSITLTLPLNLLLLISYLHFRGSWGASLEYTLYGILSTIFGILGYYSFEEALQRGPVTAVGSITAAYPVIPVLVGLTILGETLTIVQAAGIAIIMVGIIALSYSHGNGDGKSELTKACLLLSIASFSLWGLWAIFIKIAIEPVGELETVQYLGLHVFVAPIIAFQYLRYRRSQGAVIIPKWSLWMRIAVIAVILGQLAFWGEVYALGRGPVSIIIPLIAAYPAVTILLAYTFLKERLRMLEWLFVIAIVFGIILVSTV